MTHELSIQNGKVEMAYFIGDEVPWHGLGTVLPIDATLDQWAEAAMPFHIDRSRVRYLPAADSTEMLIDDSHHVLFRRDTKAVLGLVSDKFKIVQPRAALEAMADIAGSIGFHICTAGSLKGGRKLWVQAESTLTDNVLGNDVIKGRLLIATACDGSMKTHVKDVCTRVVCNNTVSMAMAERGRNEVRISHRTTFDVADIKARLGIVENNFVQFIKMARELAKCQVSPDVVDRFIMQLLAAPAVNLDDDDKADTVRASQGYRKIEALFNGQAKGSELTGVKGTAWGLLNSVTEYIDHHRGNSATTSDNRMDYSWFGAGDALKSAALSSVMAMVQ